MTRFHALGVLATFTSFCVLVGACGSPEVVDHQTPFGVVDGGPGTGTSDSGGPDLNVDSGNGDAANVPDADTSDAAAVCGDGVVDPGESCDDGKSIPGDGCSGTCQTEPGWECLTPGQPCTQITTPAICGNGIIEGAEGCDLGDPKNDGTLGCAPDCQPVPGWSCPATGDPCTRDAYCGDGIVQSTIGEQCDDGTNDGSQGCLPTCLKVDGYNCPPTGGPCSVAAYCGNGVLDTGEQCDDRNTHGSDGCSGTCLIETGFSCPIPGGACVRLCGNSKLDAGEQCDDGNFLPHDGCSLKCQIEEGYSCPDIGSPCLFTPPPICGNGLKEGVEDCDDGNVTGGDGCSSSCKVEAGWKCTAPKTPCVASQCGDGILAGAEQCDDGNPTSGDGCSATCTIEANANCPASAGPCVPMKCGDGKVTGTEQCDDFVNDGKHGCSATCQVIPGWECPLAGTQCIAVCGDGKVVGDEQCDEQADVACCSATCKLKPGFVCDPTKTPHSQPAAPYCGDHIVDGPSNPTSPVRGPEQCDDGNKLPFDGCSPTCTNEPLCGTKNTNLPSPPTVPFQCFALCGDGIVLPPEDCDDGNTQTGDGCDASCKVEKNPNTNLPAFTCTQPPPGASLTLPVVLRDFTPRTHPQFSVDPVSNRRLPGIPLSALAQIPTPAGSLRPFRYVPTYNTAFASPAFGTAGTTNIANWTMNGPGWVGADVVLVASNAATLTAGNANPLLTPAGRFAQWYVDDPTVNISVPSTITLRQIAAGTFQYSCNAAGCDSAFPGGYFPLDGQGWVQLGQETARSDGTNLHNFSFTTETRYWFAFQGNEQLSFFGDDDLWVFVNGQLTLDIGGIHSQTNGQFTLAANGVATTCVENIPGDGGNNPAGPAPNCTTVNLGLTLGNVYEIQVFNAERHISQSNFQLTLKGFNGAPSVCTPICGDGFVAGTEQCDRGAGNVPPTGPTYGSCTTDCKLGPYCGDNKLLSPPEVCDNGLNLQTYSLVPPTAGVCAPGCVEPAFCGDQIVQRVNNEECDDGTAGNQNTYGHCQTNCKLGPRCGDGSISNGEACDDGANNGAPSSGCTATCQKRCGDHIKEVGEDCDDGTGPAGNGSATSLCDTSCQYKCGNGVPDPGEQCDDGTNDGSYGTCNKDCTFAPSCGDGVVQDPPEACDNGALNSSTAYGPGSCTDRCVPGGICGDGLINGPAGLEKCDDGQNSGQPGSCTPDCKAYVPTKQCGDGTIQPPEKCDDGKNVNGTAASKCDTSCRLKCGNGTLDPGETCDNGVNDGSYGTCTPTCKLAGYCGDGTKNGNEQCDDGANNVPAATAYGPKVCTTACVAAPFCGDGRVQPPREQCEGNQLCLNCQSTVTK